MTSELAKTFSPTNQEGCVDYRFNDDLKQIFGSLSDDVMAGLNTFKRQTTELENRYGGLAFKLCKAFIEHIEHLNRNEQDDTNKWKWRSKALKKQLRQGLQELGFKPSNASKLIGAAELIERIKPFEYNCDFKSLEEHQESERFYKWAKKLSISSQYEISRMELRDTFSFIGNEASVRTQLQELSQDFTKEVSRNELASLRLRFPKRKDETRGRKPARKTIKPAQSSLATVDVFVLADSGSPSEEAVQETQEQLIHKLVDLVSRIDIEGVLVNPELNSLLCTCINQLNAIANIVSDTTTDRNSLPIQN